MLIQALCEYYDRLSAKGLVLPDGCSKVSISYLISLKPDGTMDDIIDWRKKITEEKNGKNKEKFVPRTVVMPRRTEKTGIDCNYIEHRPLYIFGLNYDAETSGFTTEDKTKKAVNSHRAFVKKTEECFKGLESPVIQAYVNFAEKWNPEAEINNALLMKFGKQITTGYFAFCLSGHPEILLHEDSMVNLKWEEYCQNTANGDEYKGICAITGEKLPVARIHDKIKGVQGGQSSGTTMVSFNNPSEYSYGKEQSFNSNISEKAMKKYTEALNYLLADKRHVTHLGDMTILHWASSADDSCDDLFDMLLMQDGIDAQHMDDLLKSVASGMRQGTVTINLGDMEEQINPDVTYYMVGIKPNATRLSVKFIYRQSFGKILNNIVCHQNDLKLTETGLPIPLWRIKDELKNPNAKSDEVDPSAMAKILDSIILGRKYPDYLLNTIVRRVKTDSDKDNRPEAPVNGSNKKINYTRMAILKACINRDDRMHGKKEEINMALDRQNNTPAYLCGRLFAVLEKTQQAASNNSLNRTIKDSYFSSAMSKPSVVFPKILSLAQHHLAKLDNPFFLNREITEIIAQMGSEFPDTLNLKEQGIFILGYYQQCSSKN